MFGIMLLFATPAIAPAQDQCPHVVVSSGAQPGGRITYTGMVDGGDPDASATFNWTISAGTIVSGQGTPAIEVEAEPNEFVTATLDVGGYDRSCATSQSATEEAQPADTSDCPLLMLVTDSPARGKGIFGAQLFPEFSGAKWRWSISEGKIVRGQGTGRIDIEAAPGRTVTGTITVEGAPAQCKLAETQALRIK
ncbi:MAG: hypothetical protein KF730_15695 [Sphingomonas sp.]|uniref:hypothetical protein n=1 Tax=Sphingomonas sp. TaxID=28214 RepID=UPI0025CDF67C|nr:hypothetical protein [Sphingomonas sp.]MBX3566009.1 hypothetical protein [Sphingomonas sp.]